MTGKQAYQNRTAVVHFGPTRADCLDLVNAENHQPLIEHLQAPLQAQLSPERHKLNCRDTSGYTIHGFQSRQLQGWLGEAQTIAICRVRCQSCRAVFTVLPSFILRYRRQDADCLGKLLALNLGMGLSNRETATIYSWLGTERGWQPGWVWSLVQWLGNLMPVCLLLLRLGLT
ncbi:MAG: DUF6431 domain-containing protein, partial [Thermosynechococcaceae cyanobacterium]